MNHPLDACPPGLSRDDRRALPVASGVLLCCMRLTVIGMKRGTEVASNIESMLDALGAESVSPHLEAFMSAISSGCTRMIDIRCICHTRLAADERALLDVLSLAQARRLVEARRVLRGFVTPAGAEAALRGAEGIGLGLAFAGHALLEAGCCGSDAASGVNTTLH